MTDLPPYPASAGPIVARQLANSRERIADEIAALEHELAITDRAFAGAFARSDSRTATRDRISALAKTSRRA